MIVPSSHHSSKRERAPEAEGSPTQRWPAFVINLDERPDRRSAFEAFALRSGVIAERIPALSHDSAETAGFRSCSPKTERNEWLLSGGAFGCAASHLLVYQAIVDAGHQGAMVFEDDVCFEPQFVARANAALDSIPTTTHVVQFGALGQRTGHRSRILDTIHRQWTGRTRDRVAPATFGMGAHCYWLSQDFAAAAIQVFQPIWAPIDAMICAVTHYSSWSCERHYPVLASQTESMSDIRTNAAAFAANAK